jgi:hypothetical protein
MSGPNSDLPSPTVSLNLAVAHAAAHPVEVLPAHFHGQTLAGPGWDAAAMFFGTLAWMGVYYTGPLFAEIDDDGAIGYILHCIAMGTVANLVVLPLVQRNHLSRGETAEQANAEIKKYFILCTIPDILYEPVADWLAAMSTQHDVTGLDFKKYADPNFTLGEISEAFLLFGIGFGSIYYGGVKLIQHYSPDEDDEPEPEVLHASTLLRMLRNFRQAYESELSGAGIAAIQYFIFYLTDYLFDVDWVTFEETMPQILGMCVMMAAYTFVADAIPIWLHRVEDKMTIEVVDEYKAPPIDIPPANSARFFQTRVEEAKRDTGDTQEILYPLLGTALP